MATAQEPKPASLPPHLSVVIPAFNEESRIGASLARVIEYLDGRGDSYEILVVDDGSTDYTREVVSAVAGASECVQILHYDGNRGKGYAVRYGMLHATGDNVLMCDADLATPIEEVEHLLAAIEQGSEVAIGSRDVPGSKLERRQSILREAAGKTFNRCVQMWAVRGIHDTQCGFKLFTRAAAQNIFGLCQIDNFSFDVETLFVARHLGYAISEVPVRWAHQEGSKVKPLRDGLRMLRTIFRIRATNYEKKGVGVRA